jgi:hypothetical protein
MLKERPLNVRMTMIMICSLCQMVGTFEITLQESKYYSKLQQIQQKSLLQYSLYYCITQFEGGPDGFESQYSPHQLKKGHPAPLSCRKCCQRPS